MITTPSGPAVAIGPADVIYSVPSARVLTPLDFAIAREHAERLLKLTNSNRVRVPLGDGTELTLIRGIPWRKGK